MTNPNPVKKALFNPLPADLVVEYRNDDNSVSSLTMPAMEISYFEGYKAEFMEKHMAEAIYHKRGNKLNHDLDIGEIKKEIEINGGD